MGDYSCFFYGTLIFPPILRRVINDGKSEREPNVDLENLVPAVLKGYKRRKVYGVEYPAILRADNDEQETRGVLVKGLTVTDIKRLDRFEGDQYVRTDVEVYIKDSPPHSPSRPHYQPSLSLSNPHPDQPSYTINKGTFSDEDYEAIKDSHPLLVPAQTYVWIDSPALLEDEDWDPEEFKASIKNWIADDHPDFQ